MVGRPESDLYSPVKEFLEEQGFTVRGEVGDCDVMAIRGEEIVVVEMKTAFNLTLVFQAIDRQLVTDHVYVAVEAPRRRTRSGNSWPNIKRLCARLGLGLLAIHFSKVAKPVVEVVRDAGSVAPAKRHKRMVQLVAEFNRRSGDYNVGGSSRRQPVVTAYREDALRLAYHLQMHGQLRVRDLVKMADCPKAQSILAKNFYGWFERVQHGTYRLTPEGDAALEEYSQVVADSLASSNHLSPTAPDS